MAAQAGRGSIISVLTAYVVSGLGGSSGAAQAGGGVVGRGSGGIAEEQAALRRVATLVAQGRAPEEVFAAVTAEVRKLVAVEMTAMGRYDPDGVVTMVGWSMTDPDPAPPARTALGGRNVTTLVFETGRPARIDDFSTRSGAVAEAVRAMGVRATVGVPITLEGGVWGVMLVSSTRREPLPSDTEARLAGFTVHPRVRPGWAEGPGEALGGRFSVQSPVGGGTRLDVTLRCNSASVGA